MRVFISVVSHGHGSIIKQLDVLREISETYCVVIKNNKFDGELETYVQHSNICLLNSHYGLGFGENNNFVFNYCVNALNMSVDNDFLIVLNPDVIITPCAINDLVSNMISRDVKIAGINLFKDESYSVYDPSVRHFPTLPGFVKSFIGKSNPAIINKSLISSPVAVDWCAGSFLAFSAAHYGLLKGFDEGYFMYCEDIDICYRSFKLGFPIVYFPDIKAIHLAKHNNRKILSRHFWWHVKSIVRFLCRQRNLVGVRTSVEAQMTNNVVSIK